MVVRDYLSWILDRPLRKKDKEELLYEKPQGIVIAGCADGDKVLLKPDGTVYRMNHEVPEVYEDWQTLPQFIADTLEEAG